jgi:hypothetical protein
MQHLRDVLKAIICKESGLTRTTLEQLLGVVEQLPVDEVRFCHQLVRAQRALVIFDVEHGVTMGGEIVADQHPVALEIHALGAHDGAVTSVLS